VRHYGPGNGRRDVGEEGLLVAGREVGEDGGDLGF